MFRAAKFCTGVNIKVGNSNGVRNNKSPIQMPITPGLIKIFFAVILPPSEMAAEGVISRINVSFSAH